MQQLHTATRVRFKRGQLTRLKRRITYGRCKIKVVEGQEVSPVDLLAQCQAPAGFRVIHLAQILGVAPKDGKKYLKREAGKNIYQGELLAAKKVLFGLKSDLLLSPIDGVVDTYDDKRGDLRIKFLPKIAKLISGVYGIVDRVDQNSGTVTIRTLVDVVYGLFGSGQPREGNLRILGSPGMLTSSKQISHGLEQQIVVAGGVVFSEGFHKAISLGVAGIVCGGVNVADYLSITGEDLSLAKKKWSDVGTTLLVTEGFGSVSIGEDIYSLLTFHQGKFAIIEGNLGRIILPSRDKDSMMIIRKTRLPVSQRDSLSVVFAAGLAAIEIGTKVRSISSPELGSQGVVKAIDQTLTKLPSGVLTYLVTVEGRNSKFRVPYANLEIID